MRAPWRGAIFTLTAYRLTLPGDEIEVGRSRPFDNDQLASVFQHILQLMDTLQLTLTSWRKVVSEGQATPQQ
jgi:hypothetical protein